MSELSAHHKKTIWLGSGLLCFVLLIGLAIWFAWSRLHERTNDSYVNGNMITLTPQISGIVTAILADNTQLVEQGQPLIEIDRHYYEIGLQKAKADLAEQVRSVCGMFIRVEELEAKKLSAQAALLRAQLDYQHRKNLVDDGSVSREEFEHSQTTLTSAFAYLKEVEKELGSAIAKIEKTTISSHPLVEQAKAAVKTAFLNLHRCTVRAPARGIVTLRKAQVGQWIQEASPLLSLVPLNQIWVDANFREVELKHLRIGQPVELFSDMYGKSVPFHGSVVGLNPGTGSIFSVLPPQNATGNWIKIVQRVPVKIALDPQELEKHPLVLGLSMTVTVKTETRTGLQLPDPSSVNPIYRSEIYEQELDGVEELIDDIIANNLYGN